MWSQVGAISFSPWRIANWDLLHFQWPHYGQAISISEKVGNSREVKLDFNRNIPGWQLKTFLRWMKYFKVDEIFQGGWNMQVLRIRSKFWGKSMEFQPEGEVRAKYFISEIFCKFLNLDIFNQNGGAIKATIDHFRRIIAWKLWTNLTVCQSLVCPCYPLEKLHIRWVWDWKIGGRSTLGTKSPAASTTCLVLRGRLTPTTNTKYRIWNTNS